MTRDVRTKLFVRQRTDADANLCVAADTDGQTLMRPSTIVNCA